MITRCDWCTNDPLYLHYHDEEWGVPIYSPDKLFEMLILEGMQAGLNWLTILKKRRAMQSAFFNFSPERLAHLSENELQQHLTNKHIIRHPLKIRALRQNARSWLEIAARQNPTDYIWQFSNGLVIKNQWQSKDAVPTQTVISQAMAKQLKKDGFLFVGATTCYAFMQAVGIVNDHLQTCFRWQQINNLV